MHRAIGLLTCAGLAGASAAQDITITVENLLQDGSFSFTPVWLAAHNGDFDGFDNGGFASAEIEALAEAGDTGPIMDAFDASGAGLAGGVQTTLMEPNGAPVFGPGESNSVNLNVGDPTVNRWFSFGSMIVPSNDLFMANDDPFGYEIFDAGGGFAGPVEILVFGADIYDAGTEVNDAFGGAAFSTNGGDSVDENNPIRLFFTENGDQDYLDSFIGTDTVDGGTITNSFGPDDAIARITIVPAPASVALLGFSALCLTRRRR